MVNNLKETYLKFANIIESFSKDKSGITQFYNKFEHLIHDFLVENLKNNLFHSSILVHDITGRVTVKGQIRPKLDSPLAVELAKKFEQDVESIDKDSQRENYISLTELLIKPYPLKNILIFKKSTSSKFDSYFSGFNKFNLDENNESLSVKNFVRNLHLKFDQVSNKIANWMDFNRAYVTIAENNGISDYFIYAIRPYAFQDKFNSILVIHASRQLTEEEAILIELLLHRFSSELAILEIERLSKIEMERIKTIEQIETLNNISASTHAIKTFIGSKFSPLLNSLAFKLKDSPLITLIARLIQSKDDLLYSAELINLMSKISQTDLPTSKILEYLESTQFFANTQTIIDLKQIFDSLLAIKLDKNENPRFAILKKIRLVYYENSLEIENNLDLTGIFSFQNIFPTIRFYEFLCATILENSDKHSGLNTKTIQIIHEKERRQLLFKSEIAAIKISSTGDEITEFTGNFRVFNALLTQLRIGNLRLYKIANESYFTMELNYN
ncbi:hypothetical protein [Emticicia sp. W12TSBA100-4]|uniref:hypothetical protein n=1 Tax=Emticicia sp. W12TSBA100-4 TaxID=3160965 RepID=UPI0033057EE3